MAGLQASVSRTPNNKTKKRNSPMGTVTMWMSALFGVCVVFVVVQTVRMTPQSAVVAGLENFYMPMYNGNNNGHGHSTTLRSPAPKLPQQQESPDQFSVYAREGVSPQVWQRLVTEWNVQSVLDVGCGRGILGTWWDHHTNSMVGANNRTTASNRRPGQSSYSCTDAQNHHLLRNADDQQQNQNHNNLMFVQHDYTRGPWWPSNTYDLAWVVDFLPHVPPHVMPNYIATLEQAAMLVVTWEDYYYHGNDNDDENDDEDEANNEATLKNHSYIPATSAFTTTSDVLWKSKFQLHNFVYSSEATRQIRQWAWEERQSHTLGPDGYPLDASHIWGQAHVFFNPRVVGSHSLEHAHLLLPTTTTTSTSLSAAESSVAWTNYLQNHIRFPENAYPEQQAIWGPAAAHMEERGGLRNPTSEIPIFAKPSSSRPTNGTSVAGAVGKKNPGADIEMVSLLKQFEQKQFPSQPIPVVAWPYAEVGIKTAEHLHIEEDGIGQSQYLQMSKDLNNFDPNVVWVGDIGCCARWGPWCKQFAGKVRDAQDARRKQGLPLHWPIFIVDFGDGQGAPHCPAVDALIGESNIRYNTRSLVRRLWDPKANWTTFNSKIKMVQQGHTYRHAPLVVRTDTVAALDEDLKKRGLMLEYALEELDRPVDVSHYWPVGDQSMVGTIYSQLRTRVGDVVLQVGRKHNLNVFCGLKGDAVRTGRRGVKQAYIEGLLESKIVVVTQRDSWEDHYRLFEALIGGALVLTDRMHGMPAGLANGTSIVEFDSAESLESLILYYLKHNEERRAIAKAGRLVAMTRHRTWHRVEEIIFGEVRSQCQNQPKGSKCPYVVNGTESM